MESSVAARAGSHYGGPQLSRQNQKPHAKPKTSRQKQNTSRQNRKPHGKTENLTAKTKTSQQKQNTSRQNQRVKDLTAKPNTSQQKPNTSRQKQIPTAKPKLFCFCREVFDFVVRYFVIAVRFLFLP